MKNKRDPRHKKRAGVVKKLFAFSFQKQPLPSILAKKVLASQLKIDKIIQRSAPQFPIKRINKIDLAILRLAVYELIIVPVEPYKVIIDEAVELAKTYSSEKGPKFVNGVLGDIIKNIDRDHVSSA